MNKVNASQWKIIEPEFNPEYLQHYETIFTLGNGYLGTRGSLEEEYAESNPGTFIAGTYDQAPEEVTELPKVANWTAAEVELAGERFDLKTGEILDYQRVLNLKQGTLQRMVKWKSPQGKITDIRFKRFVSRADQHKLGLKLALEPKNYSGTVKLTSKLDGQVTNSGTQHFIEQEKCALKEESGVYLVQRTQESAIDVALAVAHNLNTEGFTEEYKIARRQINYCLTGEVEAGQEITLEKLSGIYTSREETAPKKEAIAAVQEAAAAGYDKLESEHSQVWHRDWQQADVKIAGPTFDQLAVRFAVFQQLQMANKSDDQVSIAAKGLAGEGYRGHVFWDNEIFNLPFFIYNYPEIAKSLLNYRYHTLEGARKKAADNGYEGAQYAWESARTGEETTPKWGGLDIETGEPIRIWCGEIEQHITADIAYAVDHYYRVTGDQEFLLDYGLEILLSTSRFWASRVEYNESRERYEIRDVLGPDEYSEHVDNDVYTNMLVKWQLDRTLELAQKIKKEHPEVWSQLAEKLSLVENELDRWQEIAEKMFINYDEKEKLYIQYEGFFADDNVDEKIKQAKKQEVPLPDVMSWEQVNQSQALKQPDVIMLQYLLSDQFDYEERKAAWKLYEPKTMHDSSLSPSIHAIVAVEMGEVDKAYDYFQMSSEVDLTVGGSEAGLHAACLGGLWQAVVNGFAGLRVKKDQIELNPQLPPVWEELEFSIIWNGQELAIKITRDKLKIKTLGDKENLVPLKVQETCYTLQEEKIIDLD